MKYEIVGIEHAVGDFTPTTGKNANTVQHYDVYRLHTLKNSKDAYGQITAVVRATPDQMGQIIADLGGNIADVPGHILDMEVRNSFGKINLTTTTRSSRGGYSARAKQQKPKSISIHVRSLPGFPIGSYRLRKSELALCIGFA